MKLSAGKIIGFIVLSLVTLGALLLAGQFAGGIFLLKRLGLDPHTVGVFTLWDYYSAYGKMGGDVGKYIKMSLAMSFAPMVILLFMFVAILFNRKTLIDKLYGDAKFATDMELRRANMLIEEKNIFKLSADTPDHGAKWPPLLLGKKGSNYVVDKSQEYTTLSAAPGAGKGVSFVVPNLLFYYHNVVNFDPKLENFRITSGYREKVLGQKIFLFTPDNTDKARPEDGNIQAPLIPHESTHCWNPLDYISADPKRSLFEIRTITSIIIEAPEGPNKGFYLDARKALDGILLYLMETPEEERTMYNAGVINDNPIGFDKWAPIVISQRERAGKPLSEQCVRLLMGYANESEKKRDTTRGIVSTALDPFSDPYSRAATRKSDFSFWDLRKKKMSIYVGISPDNIPKFRAMLNLFFAQAITCNVGVLPEDGPKDEAGNPILKYQVLFMLDEFVALGPIEVIRSSSGYTRAYNVRYAIVFQNKAQVFADQCYGRAGGESLLDTFHNEIVFATESTSEAKDYSERLGYITIKHRERSRTRAKGGNSSTDNTQRFQRALMLPQEIQRLPYEEELLFKKGGRVNPVHMNKIVWYKDENFKKRANMPLPEVPPMVFDDFPKVSGL